MVIPPGIYPNMGMERYHAWKVDKDNLKDSPVSCSFLKAFAPNPYEWLHSPAFKQTEGMKTGSLFDLALTDPRELSNQAVVSPYSDFRTKEAREWRDQKTADGCLIVSDSELEKATKAAQEVRSHPIAGDILDGAEFQVGIIGKDNGINLKCLLDVLPKVGNSWDNCLVDYKTTANGLDDDSISQTIGKYKYHWQAAFYIGLANKFHTRKFNGFSFIWQSTKTLEVRVTTLRLGSTALLDGDRCIYAALQEFAKCAENGIQSRYKYTVDQVDIKPYHATPEQDGEGGE